MEQFCLFKDAVYLVVQRLSFLEEKVRKLEARPLEEVPEPKPTSNYSSAHAFRNFKTNKAGNAGSGVKRGYVTSSPTTPKKAKLLPRTPAAPSPNYPFKPSVKILPRDPNVPSPIKKAAEQDQQKDASKTKQSEDPNANKADVKVDATTVEDKVSDSKASETTSKGSEVVLGEDEIKEEPDTEKMDTDVVDSPEKTQQDDGQVPPDGTSKNDQDKVVVDESNIPSSQESAITDSSAGNPAIDAVKEEVESENADNASVGEDGLPILEDATADLDEDLGDESGQDDGDMDIDQKPELPLDDELGGDISGSEASVSSLASSSSKPRLSTRRRQAATAASSSTAVEKTTEEEKPVMYTARGRRHTVPRRYAEFTGHDNVVSILKSQQRAEKTAAAAGSSKSSRRQAVTPTKSQDAPPPKIKKMVKSTKTPSPKKLPALTDSDGEGEPGPSKKKSGAPAISNDRPPCVDALVDRVMAREVDSDGMVSLTLNRSLSTLFL